MPFEYFIRPFQTPDAHGRIIVPSTPSASTERATITWGGSAPGTVPTPKQSGVNVECCNETLTESSRTGNTVRINASGDEDSYINVHRATEVKLRKKEKNNCEGTLEKISWVNAEVKSYFADLAADIHSSDAAFAPFGIDDSGECRQTLKLQPNTTAA